MTYKNGIVIAEIEQKYMKKDLPAFRPGDTVVVKVEVEARELGKKDKKDTKKEANKVGVVRQQAFEGIVIAVKKPKSINASFSVRKISYGEGVTRVFQTHSPLVKSIEVKRKGKVRKAKLYYLEQKSGKEARIKERLSNKSENKDIEK